MKRAFALICACFSLSGCMTTEAMYMPDGRQGYSISCSGTVRSWNDCLRVASETCGAAGYDVFQQNGESGWVPAPNVGFGALPTASRHMMFACKQ